MPDPRSYARAAVLSGAISVEPPPVDLLEMRVVPVRRVVDNIAPPLDLTAVPFRYRNAEPLRPRHGRACGRRRRR